MTHLSWRKILEAVERGDRPSHLDACADCDARWAKAQGMFSAMLPETKTPQAIEDLARRILERSKDRKPTRLPGLRWALAAATVILLVGTAYLWQHRQTDLERQYAQVLSGDLVRYPAGLDSLLPGVSSGEMRYWLEVSDILSE